MTNDVKVKLKIRGINALMTSAPVVSAVAQRAKRIAAAAGEGFEATVVPHKWTARAFVRPVTREAKEREAREKVLNRALDAGR